MKVPPGTSRGPAIWTSLTSTGYSMAGSHEISGDRQYAPAAEVQYEPATTCLRRAAGTVEPELEEAALARSRRDPFLGRAP